MATQDDSNTLERTLKDALACAAAALAICKLAETFDAPLRPSSCWAAREMLARADDLRDAEANDENGLYAWPLVPITCGSIAVLTIGAANRGGENEGLPAEAVYMLGVNIETLIKAIQAAIDQREFEQLELCYG